MKVLFVNGPSLEVMDCADIHAAALAVFGTTPQRELPDFVVVDDVVLRMLVNVPRRETQRDIKPVSVCFPERTETSSGARTRRTSATARFVPAAFAPRRPGTRGRR
jgi:hypothetical protein